MHYLITESVTSVLRALQTLKNHQNFFDEQIDLYSFPEMVHRKEGRACLGQLLGNRQPVVHIYVGRLPATCTD